MKSVLKKKKEIRRSTVNNRVRCQTVNVYVIKVAVCTVVKEERILKKLFSKYEKAPRLL